MTRRVANLLGLLCCLGLLGYAAYAQAVLHLEPCPLCIFQRVGIAATGLVFLGAVLHAPRGSGAMVYGVLILLTVAATIGVAMRHIWIQHLPEGSVPVCGATLDYMLDVFPLTDVIRKVLTGSGECAKVTWSFLGASMPEWVLIAAFGLAALGSWANLVPPRRAATQASA
jgi:disulfide bond formation protein DsbB